MRVIRGDDQAAIVLQSAVQPGTGRAIVARCRVNDLIVGRKRSGIIGGYRIITGIASRYDGRRARPIGSLAYFRKHRGVRGAVLDPRDSYGRIGEENAVVLAGKWRRRPLKSRRAQALHVIGDGGLHEARDVVDLRPSRIGRTVKDGDDLDAGQRVIVVAVDLETEVERAVLVSAFEIGQDEGMGRGLWNIAGALVHREIAGRE